MPKIKGMSVITLTDWLDQGRSRAELKGALRDGDLRMLRRGVVTDAVSAAPVDLHRLRVQAAADVIGPDTLFAQESAAVLHGLPLLTPRLAEVVAVRTGGGHGQVTGGLHTRSSDVADGDVTRIDGLPVTGLDRTVADLLRRLPFPEAVMVADAGLRQGLVREELLERTASGRGCRMARAAIEFADKRSESAGESLSRVRIHRAGLPVPELQFVMLSSDGGFLGRLDFWWEEQRLAGEFDGMAKYSTLRAPGVTTAEVLRAEKRREQAIVAEGNRLVRWIWADLWNGNLERLLGRLLRP